MISQSDYRNRIFFICLLFIVIAVDHSNAQYSSVDKELVRTTFNREFDNQILSEYLNSGDKRKINAALLSIANSADSSLAHLIFSTIPDYDDKLLPFTLGQLGGSQRINNFILKKISDGNDDYRRDYFEAAGKSGDSTLIKSLIDLYNNNIHMMDGISLSFARYAMKGMHAFRNEQIRILKNELSDESLPYQRVFDALYALNRMNGDSSLSNEVINILESSSEKVSGVREHKLRKSVVVYSLNALRRINHFPDNYELALRLISNDDWLIRAEAVKTVCFYPFSSMSEAESFFYLLKDNNPNVARQTAMSVADLNLTVKLKDEIYPILKKYLGDKTLTDNTRGELYLSVLKLYPGSENDLNIKDLIDPEFLYRSFEHTEMTESSLQFLFDKLKSETVHLNGFIIQSLLRYQEKLSNNETLTQSLLYGLSSQFPALASSTASGLQENFIRSHSEVLQEIIISQIIANLNNNDFTEALSSLVILAEKIDTGFADTILDLLSSSELNPVQKLVAEKKQEKFIHTPDSELFEKLWSNAFRYRYAEVETTKGRFTISFLPEYAPTTTGSFIYLSESNFFDDIIFHRVVPGFVIQTGDPTGTGWGGPGYNIVSEFSHLSYEEGLVGMASLGRDTEGSQWFVMQGFFPHLDGRYTIFGRVDDGFDSVINTDRNDRIISISLKN